MNPGRIKGEQSRAERRRKDGDVKRRRTNDGGIIGVNFPFWKLERRAKKKKKLLFPQMFAAD